MRDYEIAIQTIGAWGDRLQKQSTVSRRLEWEQRVPGMKARDGLGPLPFEYIDGNRFDPRMFFRETVDGVVDIAVAADSTLGPNPSVSALVDDAKH